LNNILITGSSGFLGNRLLDTLKENHNCLGISRTTGVDITKYDDLENIDFKADVVVHAAASLSNDIEESFRTNVLGALNICKFIKERKIKHFIMISTVFIFKKIENGYFNSYGQSKKQAEEIAEIFCKENDIDLTILRFSQIYDEKREAVKSQGMLYYFIDTIRKNKNISIYGKKNPIRNYIHIKDVISVIKDVIENYNIGIFNVVNPKSHTISEIAYMIFDLINIKPNIEYLTEKEDILSIYIPSEHMYPNCIQFKDLKSGILEILSYEK